MYLKIRTHTIEIVCVSPASLCFEGEIDAAAEMKGAPVEMTVLPSLTLSLVLIAHFQAFDVQVCVCACGCVFTCV